jgi:ribokinase
MSAKVCVVGSFMMDMVASAPRRPMTGETVIGTEFATYLGGKGFNQAIAAARAGASTTFVGRLGDDDYGRAFREALRADGVDDTAVVTDANQGTGVGLPILEPDGQNSIVVVPRANWSVDVAYIRQHADVIADADVVLLQLELPLAAIAEACRCARSANTRVILNPAPFAPIEDLRGLVDVLVPNEIELLGLAGLDSVGARPSEEAAEGAFVAARKAQELWSADVIATLGAAGSIVLPKGHDAIGVPSVEVTAIDTIGAGDTFCGYLAQSLAAGGSLVEAARVANTAAAMAVTRRGAADSAPQGDEVTRYRAHSSEQVRTTS